jgi:hypothetical protein
MILGYGIKLINFYMSSLSFLKIISGSETPVTSVFRIRIGAVVWTRIRIGFEFSRSLDPDLDSAKWLNTDPESVNPDLESVNPDPESVIPDLESVNPDPE